MRYLFVSNACFPLKKTKDYRDMLVSKDEKIEEYQAKCDSYETEIKRIKTESQHVMKEYVNISNRNEAITEKVVDQEVLIIVLSIT